MANDMVSTDYYRLRGNAVDGETLAGYNLYNRLCVSCHGVGASGTDTVPDLTRQISQLSPDLFRIKILHKFVVRFTTDNWIDMEQSMFEEIRKKEQRENGELPDMPRWEHNPMVRENIDRLYRYLKARGDGVLGPDRPALLR